MADVKRKGAKPFLLGQRPGPDVMFLSYLCAQLSPSLAQLILRRPTINILTHLGPDPSPQHGSARPTPNSVVFRFIESESSKVHTFTPIQVVAQHSGLKTSKGRENPGFRPGCLLVPSGIIVLMQRDYRDGNSDGSMSQKNMSQKHGR